MMGAFNFEVEETS